MPGTEGSRAEVSSAEVSSAEMSLGRAPQRWLVLLRPQVILAFLVLLAGLWFFFSGLKSRQVNLVTLPEERTPLAQTTETIDLVIGERSLSIDLALPEERSERLSAILLALKDNAGLLWPAELPSPIIFLIADQLVLDFALERPLAISAADEWQLYSAIKATLERQNIKSFSVLINGQTSSTFLGHVAVEDAVE